RGRRDLDLLEEFEGAGPRGAAPEGRVVPPECLDHLVADPSQGIKRTERILVDEGNLFSPHRPSATLGEGAQVPAVEPDLAVGDPPRRLNETHDRERQG